MGEIVGKATVIAIADYRWKYIIYAIICWALVIAGFFTFNAKERQWQFWMAEVVMFLFGSGLLYMLFNKKYYFIGRRGAEYDQWMAEKHSDLLREDGFFTYFPNGFVFHMEKENLEINWDDIYKITARIEDELSNDDDVVMRLDYALDKFVEFDEEIPGWTKWELMVREHFPQIQENWISVLLKSNDKETVLYKKD